LGWLASVASSTYVVTVQIEAMINVYQPDYAFTSWQYTLLMWAFCLITIVFNTYAAGILPALEIASLVGHLVGFVVTLVPLLVLAPKNSARDVFVNFENNSGYNNMGTAYLVSQVTVMYCNLGSDSVVHVGPSATISLVSLLMVCCRSAKKSTTHLSPFRDACGGRIWATCLLGSSRLS
jgi:choline transport protein